MKHHSDFAISDVCKQCFNSFFSLSSPSISSKHHAYTKQGQIQGTRYSHGQGCVIDWSLSALLCQRLITLVAHEDKLTHTVVQILPLVGSSGKALQQPPLPSFEDFRSSPVANLSPVLVQKVLKPFYEYNIPVLCGCVTTSRQFSLFILVQVGIPIQLQTFSFHSSFQHDVSCDNAGSYFTVSFSENEWNTIWEARDTEGTRSTILPTKIIALQSSGRLTRLFCVQPKAIPKVHSYLQTILGAGSYFSTLTLIYLFIYFVLGVSNLMGGQRQELMHCRWQQKRLHKIAFGISCAFHVHLINYCCISAIKIVLYLELITVR